MWWSSTSTFCRTRTCIQFVFPYAKLAFITTRSALGIFSMGYSYCMPERTTRWPIFAFDSAKYMYGYCCMLFFFAHRRLAAVNESDHRHRRHEHTDIAQAEDLHTRDSHKCRYAQQIARPLPNRDSEHLDQLRKHEKL